MKRSGEVVNIAMGGGGVRGIAYIGAFDVMEKRGYIPGNIVGVSAGSMAGALAAAGYNAAGMYEAMNGFDFSGIQVNRLYDKVPLVRRFMDYTSSHAEGRQDIREFLTSRLQNGFPENNEGRKPGVLKSLATLAKEGCLFDGDLLEEWVSKTLAVKGIRTFGDLRSGKPDGTNPGGYKIRMTGVDCNRVKVVVLPDDLTFYGIDPDKFEVAKAVRISTAVPFAFKPVELVGNEGGRSKTYNLVDGGVLDKFPGWLLPAEGKALGYRLNTGENKLFGIDTPLNIIKGFILSVHDIGIQGKSPVIDQWVKSKGLTPQVPPADTKAVPANMLIGEIDVKNIGFLDFDLSAANKLYLYNSGKAAALMLLDKMEVNRRKVTGYLPYGFQIGRKWQARLHR